MYRVWFSTEELADYIIENTNLKKYEIKKQKLYESDASSGKNFHKIPDHIKKILYLDCPDLIVEKEAEPIFSIEVSSEAGTGHNSFQRFARLAASVENDVPALYIYPEASIISRSSTGTIKWDAINPAIFRAIDSMIQIYNIPSLLFYFPSDYRKYTQNPESSPNILKKGLIYDSKFMTCPCSKDTEMKKMFNIINIIIEKTRHSVLDGRQNLMKSVDVRKCVEFMKREDASKTTINGQAKRTEEMSPLTATVEIPTEYLINYLSKYNNSDYRLGELLQNREKTIIYQANAKFRGDPYPGALAAIDYLTCREGKTFENRKSNLILAFGEIEILEKEKTIKFSKKTNKNSTIKDLEIAVKNADRNNILTRSYDELKNYEIPRYYMQMRYGSTYSKSKHIRVYAYFADAILFPDGALWRDG